MANQSQSNLAKANQKFVCRTDLKVERKKLYVTWICGEFADIGNFLIHVDFGRPDLRGLDICGQATKGVWGMPWR